MLLQPQVFEQSLFFLELGEELPPHEVPGRAGKVPQGAAPRSKDNQVGSGAIVRIVGND